MASAKVKEISVFVDESGSFAPDEESSRFYLICLVLHDQDADISAWVKNLEDYLESSGLGAQHCIHVGPLIRREGEYANMLREEAFSMFSAKTEFVPEVKPEHYRLFQAADLLCSVELVCAKMNEGAGLSRSEDRFFGSEREFKRDVLKKLRQKVV